MKELAIAITADATPFVKAIESLSELPFEVVQRFLGCLEAGSQPVRFDLNGSSAAGTGDLRIVLQPSDFLLGFMAATGTGDGNRVAREKV
jgi:hypothetical protein